MIPFTVPEIRIPELAKSLKEALYSQRNSIRTLVKLEEKVAEFVGTRYAVVFASARFALYLLYRYFGCEGKLVIVPAYTCIPAANAFRWAGAKPFFVDIDPHNYNPRIDSSLLQLNNVGAVCLSYLYGLVADPMPIVEWSHRAGIPVIEDAAIALGAKVRSRMVGTFGDAAVFSLQSSKIISGWRGGVAVTDSLDLYDFLKRHQADQKKPSLLKVLFNLFIMAVRRILASPVLYRITMYPLRQITLKPSFARLLEGILDQNPSEAACGYSSEYMPISERYLYTATQANLVLAALERLDKILAIRSEYASYLISGLSGIPRVVLPRSEPNIVPAYGRFPIRIKGLKKAAAVKEFARLGIEIGTYYEYIIPDTKYFRESSNFNRDFACSRLAAEETVLLPFHTCLSMDDLDHIIAAVSRIATMELY